jgi:Response receiver domain
MSDEIRGMADLVRDVYIRPIKSLLAIDDEFPTLDELLDPVSSQTVLNKKGADSLREIIKFARTREPPWLVDVHDGKDISGDQEKKIAPRLQASDLMVLDYKLKGEELGGDTAIGIIRGLATNNHFNLVLLYTKGSAGNVVDTMHEIALGLANKNDAYKLSEEEFQVVIDSLETWQASDNSVNISEQLLEMFTNQLFVKSFERPKQSLKWILEEAENSHLKEKLSYGAQHFTAKQDLLLRWLFEERKKIISKQLFETDLGQIRINPDEGCCWISCEKLFITLLSKKCSPAEFETKIIEAIVKSHPTPHRLLLTKMRSSIEQRGLVAEIDILRDMHVQTAWLEDFLNPAPNDETSAVVGTVTRHWEAIGDVLREDLTRFGSELRAQYKGITLTDVMKRSGLHGTVPGSEETLKRYNSFISTKPIDRGHLTTGHVFSFPKRQKSEAIQLDLEGKAMVLVAKGEPNVDLEYWMCLSPACDMVPAQKGRRNTVGGVGLTDTLLPFAAVQLHRIKTSTAMGKATENLCIFLKVKNDIDAFSILEDADSKGSPVWEQMVASQSGIFENTTTNFRATTVTRFDGKVEVFELEAKVIAQLRTEYAANLLQKFGAQLTRPGLGMQFKNRSNLQKTN